MDSGVSRRKPGLEESHRDQSLASDKCLSMSEPQQDTLNPITVVRKHPLSSGHIELLYSSLLPWHTIISTGQASVAAVHRSARIPRQVSTVYETDGALHPHLASYTIHLEPSDGKRDETERKIDINVEKGQHKQVCLYLKKKNTFQV